jgi:hypothetical protein
VETGRETGPATGTLWSVILAGVGGLVLGHVLWLVAISLAIGSPSSSTIVLLITVLVILAAAGVWRLAWQRYQRQELGWAAFLAGLPVSPVLFTIIVLGVTYL